MLVLPVTNGIKQQSSTCMPKPASAFGKMLAKGEAANSHLVDTNCAVRRCGETGRCERSDCKNHYPISVRHWSTSPSECLSLPDALLFFNVLRILINLHKIPQCLDTASRSVSAMDSQRPPSASMARRSFLVRCQWSISLRPTSNALLIIGSAPCTRHSSASRYHLDTLAHVPSSAAGLVRSNYSNCRRSGPLLGIRCATATAQYITLQTFQKKVNDTQR